MEGVAAADAVIAAATSGQTARELRDHFDGENGSECYRAALTWFCNQPENDNPMATKTLKEAMVNSMSSIDRSSQLGCLTIIFDAVEGGGNPSSLDFVPALVTNIGSEAADVEEDDEEALTIETCTDFVIDKICRLTWNSGVMLNALMMLHEFDLSKAQLPSILNKFLQSFSRADSLSVPAICYNVLLLCRQGSKLLVARALIFACEQLRAASLKEQNLSYRKAFLQALGTVLLHIHFAVNQDQVYQ